MSDFWDVQAIWARAKDSPIALGRCIEAKTNSSSLKPGAGELREKLLKLLAVRGSFDSYQLSQELGKDHQQVVGAIKSVQSLGEVWNFDTYK